MKVKTGVTRKEGFGYVAYLIRWNQLYKKDEQF